MCPIVMEKEYDIHYYEVDYKKRCKILSLMDYFEDIALLQSEGAGVGINYLYGKGLIWVLYKWDINIKKYPKFGDRVKVITIPNSLYKFYAYRKFEMQSADGETLASADSEWLLVKMDTKKPIRIPEPIYRAYNVDINCSDKLNIENLKAPEMADCEKLFEVRYSDIDTNMHVNNVKYVEWAMETVSQEIVKKYMLNRLLVTYKKETRYGETIKAATSITEHDKGAVCSHSIVDMDGKELCLLKSIWTKE